MSVMYLKKLKIENYRSIEVIEIDITDNCLIFLGMNESGKSNILNSINFLNDKEPYDPRIDRKIPFYDSLAHKNTKFTYTFDLTSEEKEELISIYMNDSLVNPIAIRGNREGFIKNLIKDIVFEVGYEGSKRNETIIGNLRDSIEIKTGYLRLKNDYKSSNKKVLFADSKEFEFSGIKYINSIKCVNLDEIKPYFEEFDEEKFREDLIEDIETYFSRYKSEVIYWKYDSKMLITEPIDITNFADNPNICIPLRNIFKLAGIKNIKKDIEEKRDDLNQFKNLQKRLSDIATKHIQSIWKEYKNVRIQIDDNSKYFIVSVKDTTNLYNMKLRSDGFKRFGSFLFTISAEDRDEEDTSNKIIILDEPDISLHPTGIRYLLEEILTLSKKNIVFVATHSIFMIDRKKIDRHRIVTKEDESTNITISNKENFMQEEVLFNSLGYSLFEIMKHNNLMLEGYIDKEIIKMINDKFQTNINFNNCALCWGDGVDNIPSTMRLMSSIGRNFIICVDKDSQGLAVIEKLKRAYPDKENKILNFGEIVDSTKSTYTIEDFLPSEWMVELLNDHLRSKVTTVPTQFEDDSSNRGIIEAWNSFIRRVYPENIEQLKEGFKNRIPSLIHRKMNESEINFEEQFREFKKFITKVNALIE